MHPALSYLLAFLLALFAPTTTFAHPISLERLEAMIDAVRAEGDVPGAVVLIETGGERQIMARGMAHVASQLPMPTDALLRVASIGKLHTAAVIHHLVLDGQVSLDTQAGEVLAEHWTDGIANARNATIRHLLNHTSGVPDYYDENWLATVNEVQRNTPQRTLGFIHGRPADFPPGDGYAYSNSGYQLLGLIAQSVSGRELAALYSATLFEPIGDTRSIYDRQLAEGDVIHGYGIEDQPDTSTFTLIENSGPDGGVFTTADDLADLLQALFTPDGSLFSIGTAMLEEQIDRGNGRSRALGPMVTQLPSGLELVTHGGSIAGYSSFAAQATNAELTIIIHLNRDRPDLAAQLARHLLMEVAPDLILHD